MISITDFFFLCDQQNRGKSSYCKIIWLMSTNHLTDRMLSTAFISLCICITTLRDSHCYSYLTT